MTASTSGNERPVAGRRQTDPAALLEVTRVIYGATLQRDAWPVILQAIAPLLGTDKAMYIRLDRTHPRDSTTEVVGVSAEQAEALRTRNVNEDPIWHPLLVQPAGSVFRATELLPIEAIRAGPLYRSISQPAGIEYGIGCVIENNAAYFTVLGCMQARQDFDDDAKQVLAWLLPHLQLAQEIRSRIAAGEEGRREALLSLDRARRAMVVLDRSGYALYSNSAARYLLESAQGMELKFGRFLFDNVATQLAFERAVRAVLSRSTEEDDRPLPAQQIRVPRRGPGPPYVVTISPVHRSSSRALLPDGAGALVMLYDHDGRGALPTEQLVWLYGLTPAESRICEALYKTSSIEAAAQELCLTHHTIRSHLKNIYAKLGISTQGQLMQRLSNATVQVADDNVPGVT